MAWWNHAGLAPALGTIVIQMEVLTWPGGNHAGLAPATGAAREACQISERRGMEPARTRLTWPGGSHAGLAPALGTIVIQMEVGRPELSQ